MNKRPGIFAYLFLILGAVIVIFPYLWMVLSAFKTTAEIRQAPPIFLPSSLYLGGFIKVITGAPFFVWLLNSGVVSVAVTAAVLFTSGIAGYIYAKFDFALKKVTFILILATLMVPFEVTLIPTYLIVSYMGLLNTLWVLIIPGMVTAFGIFLCKQFCEGIPNDLIDSGRVDGASELRIFFRIIVPEIQPVLSALAIFEFMGSWNNYLWPLITINDQSKMTVPLALSFFNMMKYADIGAVMSAATLIMIPVVMVYLVFQRQFVEGLSMTGIK